MSTWRIVIGDLLGHPISQIGAIAKDVAGVDRILRPASLRMRVPSDHPSIAAAHSDGHPKLAKMRRTLRAYAPIGPNQWAIRFAGVIYQLQDTGQDDTAWTTFTAFDPMQRLATRFTGVDTTDRTGDAGVILRDMIAATNALGYTGIATTGYENGAQVCPAQTVRYDRRSIGQAAVELAGAFNGFDPILRPIHQPAGTEDGTLAALDIYARAGIDRPNAVFAWGMAPRTLRSVENIEDGMQLANTFTGLGWTPEGQNAQITATQSTAASVTDYGRYEAVETFGDVTNTTFLSQLLAEEAALRSDGRQLVNLTCSIGDDARHVPRPWIDFQAGDTVNVRAGAALRGGFNGLQRVYGFSYTVDDDGLVRVDRLMTSPDDT